MQMYAKITHTIIAAIAVAAIVWSKPTVEYRPQGIVLPLQGLPIDARSPGIELPPNGQAIARINVEMYSPARSQAAEQTMRHYAKQKLQQLGAGELLVQFFGYIPPSKRTPAPLAKYVLRGIAIKLNDGIAHD